jgi:hypothetical protein
MRAHAPAHSNSLRGYAEPAGSEFRKTSPFSSFKKQPNGLSAIAFGGPV